MIFNWFKSKELFYEDIFRKLQEKDVHYLVVGGIAVSLYGAVRLTVDADLILELRNENIDKFFKAMKELGYLPKVPVDVADFADPKKRRQWIAEKGMRVFPLYHPQRPLEIVDVFVENPIDFQEMDKEKVVKKAQGLEIPLPSLRHLVKLKRLAGRDQDLNDIKTLENLYGKLE